MLIPMTVILILLLIVGVPVSIKLITYKPKKMIELSPAAYQEQITNLEFLKANAIEAATSQLEIDRITEKYDKKMSEYKIRR